MVVIGITGGVGSGKSRVLSYLYEKFSAVVVEMDQVGRELMEPGGACFEEVCRLFPEAVVRTGPDRSTEERRSGTEHFPKEEERSGTEHFPKEEEQSGTEHFPKEEEQPGTECLPEEASKTAFGCFLDRGRIAEAVFGDPERLASLNAVIHPAVRRAVSERMALAEREGKALFVMESAILLESGYADICQDLWYVYADRDVRAGRLRESRGYSDGRTESVMAAQLSEEAYTAGCTFRLNNSGDFSETAAAIDARLAFLTRFGPPGAEA